MINRVPEWLRRFGPRFAWIIAVRTVYTATQSNNSAVCTVGIIGAVLVVGLLLFDLWEQYHPRPKRRRSREHEASEQTDI